MNLVFIFCIGACIGSFLNVVIYRLPKKESIIWPRSHCQCGKTIPMYYNIPILSWFVLHGKAICCGKRISARYPFVETLTAILITISFAQSVTISGFVISCIFICIMIVTAFIDIDTMEISDCISIGGTLLGLLLALFLPNWNAFEINFISSIFGACFGSGLILWIGLLAEAALKKEAMGFGDVQLMGVIGSFLGCQGCIFAIFGGCFILSAILSPLLFFPKFAKKLKFSKEIPFAPFLATGSIVYLLYGDQILKYF